MNWNIDICVRSLTETEPVKLLRILLNVIDSLLRYWYKIDTIRYYLPCSHCKANRRKRIHEFSKDECETAAEQGSWLVRCKTGAGIRVEKLMPELISLQSNLRQIEPYDVQMIKQIGEGGFCTIWKVIDQIISYYIIVNQI